MHLPKYDPDARTLTEAMPGEGAGDPACRYFYATFEGQLALGREMSQIGADAFASRTPESVNQPPRLPAPAPSPRPSTLLNRVARRLARFASEGRPGDDATPIASAVLRDVAAWIDERELKAQNDPYCLEASTADEVVGWLRNEADQ